MKFNLSNLFKSLLSAQVLTTANHTSKETSFKPTIAYLLQREAVVEQTIQPYRSGRVRFRGSWWNARCEQAITFNPGEIVYVVGMTGITLLVQAANFSELRQNSDLISEVDLLNQ